MGFTRFRLLEATLSPPAISADDKDAAAGELPWVLLELQAYVGKLENATTAHGKTWDGKEIQVTFCRRRPPRLSYLAVYSRDAEIPVEPQILATEDDIVLLRIVVSCQKDVFKNLDYYIYRADDGSGRPSLDHLPRPPSPYFFDARNIGILRRPTDYSSLFLRPHRSDSDSIADEYIIAGLHIAPDELQEEFEEGTFILSLFDSKMKAWTTNTVSLNRQQKQQYRNHFEHSNSKVIAIGGDAGTMAFVDLWRGVLFCDVLPAQGQAIPPLRYVPLPSTLPKSKFTGDARLARDIAIVQGGRVIKYVELQEHLKDSKIFKGLCLNDGWIAATWSRTATSSLEDTWQKDCEVDSNFMNFEGNPHFELLPKVLNDEDMPLQPFKRLDICQPTLGLHDDGDHDIIYIMTKIKRQDSKAWVIAVDMKDKAIHGVSQFAAGRTICITLAYVHSKISKYLKKDPGTQVVSKQAEMVLPQSIGKKQAEDGDDMVLD